MAAFKVLNDRPNNYTVIYDGTLADGIPHFFDLMCACSGTSASA